MADEPNGGGQGADPTQAFQNRLKKHGDDAMAFATVLFDENFQLRSKNRDLEGKVPSDGSTVLNKADSARWAKYNELGKVEDLEKLKTDHEELKTKAATYERTEDLRKVADAGWSLAALKDFDALEPGLEYVVKDEKRDGKDVKVAYVKADGKERPLEEYAKEKRPHLMASLKEEGQQVDAKRGLERSPRPAGGDNIFEATRKEEKARQEAQAKPATLRERFRGAVARN
jgi:hypothetical protein